MNQIIDSRRPIHDKTRLGYNQKDDELGSSSKIRKDDKKSYVDIVRENCEPLKENLQEAGISRHENNERTKRKVPVTQNSDPRKQAPSRRPPIPRYQIFFSGLCYAYNNYGHKAIDCKTYIRYGYNWGRNRYENSKYQVEGNYNRRSQLAPNGNYNRFEALDYDIECYRCHNFGHIARNCKSKIIGPQDRFRENRQPSVHQTNWRGRQEVSRTEECKLAPTVQNSRYHWCLDSGYSRHMTGNKNTF